MERGYFELIERTSIIESERKAAEVEFMPAFRLDGSPAGGIAVEVVFPESPSPQDWRYSKSNGVAAGLTLVDACRSAAYELIERDRLLRAWCGDLAFVPMPAPTAAFPPELLDLYDFQARILLDGDRAPSVAVIFGFPTQDPSVHPLVYGFAAKENVELALTAAARECLQRLVFLWGEEIPKVLPPFAPTAEFHQEFSLLPTSAAVFRDWLAGGHRRYARPESPLLRMEQVEFVDLTPAHLHSKVNVVKAVSKVAFPLIFGRGDVFFGNLPDDRRLHPIG